MNEWVRQWLEEVNIEELMVEELDVHEDDDLPDLNNTIHEAYLQQHTEGRPQGKEPLHGHGNKAYAPNDMAKKKHRLPSYKKKTVKVHSYVRDGDRVVQHKRRTQL